MTIYCDTSFLVSFFTRVSNYQAAAKLMATAAGTYWTPWQRLEVNNAIRLNLGNNKITAADVRIIENLIKTGITQGALLPADIPNGDWWREAETLSRAHTQILKVRTLDLLHVAAARVLKATHFYTFDKRQHALARAAGLRVN